MTFGSIIPTKGSPSSIILPSPSRRTLKATKTRNAKRADKSKGRKKSREKKTMETGQRGRFGRCESRDARRLTSPPLLRCQRLAVSRIQRLGVMCQRNMKLIINYISFLFRYILVLFFRSAFLFFIVSAARRSVFFSFV